MTAMQLPAMSAPPALRLPAGLISEDGPAYQQQDVCWIDAGTLTFGRVPGVATFLGRRTKGADEPYYAFHVLGPLGEAEVGLSVDSWGKLAALAHFDGKAPRKVEIALGGPADISVAGQRFDVQAALIAAGLTADKADGLVAHLETSANQLLEGASAITRRQIAARSRQLAALLREVLPTAPAPAAPADEEHTTPTAPDAGDGTVQDTAGAYAQGTSTDPTPEILVASEAPYPAQLSATPDPEDEKARRRR